MGNITACLTYIKIASDLTYIMETVGNHWLQRLYPFTQLVCSNLVSTVKVLELNTFWEWKETFKGHSKYVKSEFTEVSSIPALARQGRGGQHVDSSIFLKLKKQLAALLLYAC